MNQHLDLSRLSDLDLQYLQLMLQRKTNKEISYIMKVKSGTTYNHVNKIYMIFNIKTKSLDDLCELFGV